MCPRKILRSLFLVLTTLLPAAAGALECGAAHRPGATLLFPYFEADLDDAAARKTLITIQNRSFQAVLTNVVVWTNCGLPVFSFNLVIEAQGSQPIDVGDLLGNGRIPVNGDDVAFPDCAMPGADSRLDAERLRVLRDRVTGQPDPNDGLCYAQAGETATLAIGYITVDVVERCSETIRTPRDPGYFPSTTEPGIVSGANVLWGDFFLIDDAGDLAQGFAAVSVVADPAIRKVPRSGFYEQEGDDRRPLGSRYRTRFFQGGAFDGGTDVLLWTASKRYYPSECDRGCGFGHFFSPAIEVLARKETGEQDYLETWDFLTSVARLRVGDASLPIEARSGTLSFGLYFDTCRSRTKCTPPSRSPLQGWVLPIFTAEGRFSTGLDAVALDDPCADRANNP